MKSWVISLSIVVGASSIAFGWTALLNINSMPDWYYGTLLFIPFILVVWGLIHGMVVER